jgi:hypothetical protein
LPAWLADHRGALFRFKADDQRDFLLKSARIVPRQPDAVGVADLGFTVMGRKLIPPKDVLAIGLVIVGLAAVLVEAVNDQRPFDLDRSLLLTFVEHQSSAEAANGRPTGLRQYGIAPDSHDSVRLPRLVVVFERPHVPRPVSGRGKASPD